MSKCIDCKKHDDCGTGSGLVWPCGAFVPKEPMTNADRMDAMSIMEKAKFLTSVVANGCPPDMDWCCEKDSGGWDACDDCWCKWLQQPCGGVDNE